MNIVIGQTVNVITIFVVVIVIVIITQAAYSIHHSPNPSHPRPTADPFPITLVTIASPLTSTEKLRTNGTKIGEEFKLPCLTTRAHSTSTRLGMQPSTIPKA